MNWTPWIGNFWRGHLTQPGKQSREVIKCFDADSDEALEAEVRRELVEIARLNGVSDPETLKDIFLASMPPSHAPRSDPAD